MLLEKKKASYYAEHEGTDGGLRQPAVIGKHSHKEPLANGQRLGSTFRLTLRLQRSVIACLIAREYNSP